jgi:hypothetical protein
LSHPSETNILQTTLILGFHAEVEPKQMNSVELRKHVEEMYGNGLTKERTNFEPCFEQWNTRGASQTD